MTVAHRRFGIKISLTRTTSNLDEWRVTPQNSNVHKDRTKSSSLFYEKYDCYIKHLI